MVREAAVVAQRCMEAQETGVVELSNCGLMSIPDALYLFLKNTKVSKVNLSSNQLTKVPAKLANAFPHVEEVDLSSNSNITSIPDEFSSCQALKTLNLSGNKIVHVPSMSFQSLDLLNISNNLIETVTETDIQLLVNVTTVDVTQNKLSDECRSRLRNQSNFIV